uniref:MFS domain-containing protein n=1 Tax=Caenorhabditis japonica TaxID=281687 RepID=A0A8R1EDQ0_CAEJA
MVNFSVSRKLSLGSTDDEAPNFKHKTRFIILVICTLCLSIAQSDTLTLNFTIICMSGDGSSQNQTAIGHLEDMEMTMLNTSGTFVHNVETMEHKIAEGRYDYSPSERSMLFSLVAVGAMVAVYPVMLLIGKFGSRSIVFWMGMLSAVTTALIPWMAYIGFYPLLAMRFLQGAGLSTGFTLIGIVTRQWSMQVQNAFYIAVLTTFFQIGPIFTMPVAGALCTSSLGWPAVYYIHAVVTFGLFVLFYFFYRESPIRHAFVSSKELEKIQRHKGDGKREPVPIRAIITDPAILSVWISAIGNFMGIQLTMQFSPTYLNKVMGFAVEQTGTFSAIPQVVTFFLKIVAGYAADKMTCCTPQTSVKVYNWLALGGMSLSFLGLAVIPVSEPVLGLCMLIFSCSIIGFNCGAFFRSSAIYAAQHNHFIMGVNSFLNCFASLLAPVIVNIFVANDTWDEWWWVWMVHFVALFTFNIVFQIFGKGVPAEWTKPGYRRSGATVYDVESVPKATEQVVEKEA